MQNMMDMDERKEIIDCLLSRLGFFREIGIKELILPKVKNESAEEFSRVTGAKTKVMFITMTPLCGEGSGQLAKIIKAMGLEKQDAYIANIIKRGSSGEDLMRCVALLNGEIEMVRPMVIITCGDDAINTLLNEKSGVRGLSGRFHAYLGINVMPLYHPLVLIEKPELKRETWADVKTVMAFLNKP